MTLAEFKNGGVTCLQGLSNQDRWIKSWYKAFKYMPQQVISIARSVRDRRDNRQDFHVGGGEQTWEDLQNSSRAFSVRIGAKSRREQTLVVILDADGVKWHNWNKVCGRHLLVAFVEYDSFFCAGLA